MSEKGSKIGRRYSFKQVRAEYKVPAYLGAKVEFYGRPATIVAAAWDCHLIIQLEDRIDKARIRVQASRLTYLEPYVPNPCRLVKPKKTKRDRKPTDFETMYF